MCIICNLPVESYTATNFLTAFEKSRTAMKEACDLMLKCSKEAIDPDDRKAYDAQHKRMVRLMREWNRTEELREVRDNQVSPTKHT
jgi:20S proteasome alpha/beta subunit